MASLLLTEKEITEIYNRHVDTVYRVCFSFLKNRAETEDMVQETFLRLIRCGKRFENERHEKAWLIVTASNLCKDTLKNWWRKHEDIEDFLHLESGTPMENPVLDAILQLPEDYKDAVYLYYYEGYTTAEIATHCRCAEGTIRSRLSRAKKQLLKALGGDGK